MNRSVIALVAAAAFLMLASPAMAQSQATCSVIGQIAEVVGGLPGGVGSNCSTSSASAASSPVVATSEPLAVLVVGLGLLGARLLRRR